MCTCLYFISLSVWLETSETHYLSQQIIVSKLLYNVVLRLLILCLNPIVWPGRHISLCVYLFDFLLFCCLLQMASENEFEIEVDTDEYLEFNNNKLRPVFNIVEPKCNVPNCTYRSINYGSYLHHWSKVHVEHTTIHICQLCNIRFHSYMSMKRHIAFIHKRSKPGPLITKEKVKNYACRDIYGTLPYRLRTQQERDVHRNQQREKEKIQRQEMKKRCQEAVEFRELRELNLFN